MTKTKKSKSQKARDLKGKEKFLLETSVQIARLSKKNVKEIVNELNKKYNLYSSHFVLYEFKSGFIKSLIDFYLLVKVYEDPSAALFEWSQRFKPRELKNVLLLQGFLQDCNSIINTKDIEAYLAQLESVITLLMVNFNEQIVGLVGDFASDEVVKYDIFDSSTYQKFIDLVNKRKSIIPLDKFWSNNAEELKLLTADGKAYGTKHKFIHDHLTKINVNVANANKSRTNKSIGDAVIAVDAPHTFTIATLDNSFNILSTILNKKHKQLP